MKSKALSSTNVFLKAPNAGSKIAQNAASSTSIETGKSSASYVVRANKVNINRKTTPKPSRR